MKQFLELIQVAIGTRSRLSSIPTMEEWEAMYQMSKKQALTGIAYSGIERLPKEQRPIIDLTYPWSEEVKAIEAQNRQVQKRAGQLLRHMEQDGFYALILKGLSYAHYYPEELQNRRTPGDIDLLMWPKQSGLSAQAQHQRVIDYCLNLLPNHHVCYIHVDFPVFSDIPVEAHFRPSFLCNPFRNRELQQWFEAQKSTLLSSDPTPFHRICCELHLFKHLFETGFGMRQLLDYYFLCQRQEGLDRRNLPPFLSPKFHAALNGLSRYLFDPDSPKPSSESLFLWHEVQLGGNFGQYDPRIRKSHNAMIYAWEKLKHNLRLIRHYPAEVLWEPWFRLYHWYWRQKNA